MLKIRLTRVGKKHQPSYRIVVTPKENPALGQYIDLLGTYNPLKGSVSLDTEKALAWLNKGAQPSERLARLLEKAGVSHKSIVVKRYQPKPKDEAEPQAPAKDTSTEPELNEEMTSEAKPEDSVNEAVVEPDKEG